MLWERVYKERMSWSYFYHVAKPFEKKSKRFTIPKLVDGGTKMVFEEVKSKPVFNFEETGSEIEGKFVGTEEGQFGDNFLIECKSGETFTVFGKTVLTTKMKSVPAGALVKITYLGEVKAKKGGTMYKDFKVEVDKQ